MKSRWKRVVGVMVATAALGINCLGQAQEPADAPTAQPQAADAPAAVAPAADTELTAEVQQLRAEVDQLKDQLAHLNSVLEQMQSRQATPEKAAAPSKGKRASTTSSKKSATAPPAPPSAAPVAEEATPLTVLVFHDGHRTEARNYAIVGQTLWIYTEDDSKKVPLSELDVAATKNANSDRGIIFQVPPTK